MPVNSENFTNANFTEILRTLVQSRKTGHLTIQQMGETGMVTLENGMIVNAKTSSLTGMAALFQFVAWHDIHFEFQEASLSPDLPRDLEVYDPQILITGIARKLKEGAALH